MKELHTEFSKKNIQHKDFTRKVTDLKKNCKTIPLNKRARAVIRHLFIIK
jgi:hypothetical protein